MNSKHLLYVLLFFVMIIFFAGCGQIPVEESKTELPPANPPAGRVELPPVDEIEKIIFRKGRGYKTLCTQEGIGAVVDYLSSITYEEIREDDLNGWAYYIRIIHKSGQEEDEVRVSFLPHRIHWGEKWYKGNEEIIDSLTVLYNDPALE
jgi:hypothetical protein